MCYAVVVMQAKSIRILVAEADANICEIIKRCAMGEQWQMDEARDGVLAIKLLRRRSYQFLILSCELPLVDGPMVLELMRSQRLNVGSEQGDVPHFRVGCPVMFIGKSGTEEERLAAFAAGGNDYLRKPFYPRELVARMRNLMALFGIADQKRDSLSAGPIRIECQTQRVFAGDRPVKLTPREYKLLQLLVSRPDHAFSRDELLSAAWGETYEGGDRTVDTHIKSLREKLRPHQGCIKTIWGFGYKLSVEE